MWKPSQPGPSPVAPVPEPIRPTPAPTTYEPPVRAAAPTGDQATIGKGLVIKGEISGSESLLATDRVDIRSEGALTGDVAAARISIEDGAFFKGGIDIRKPEGKPTPGTPAVTEPVQA